MLQIKVDGFDGPLDLLLDLIERNQLDITALSLIEITDQYWHHVESAPEIQPDALAEFIGVGSKLLYLKSCALLPSASPPEARADAEDVAGELTEMLEEYRRFKDAADLFRQLEEQGRRTYARLAPPKGIPLPPGLQGVTLDTLLEAVKEALARKPAEPEEGILQIEPVSVDEKARDITAALVRRGRLRFRPLLAACKTRTEIVVLFLAVLELIKSGQLWAEQERPFGEITLVEAAPEPA
ncbi:MAG TPA: ScpA family protein [Dehalococcoidia bacterium]|nr:ScpA family protein [Dehalococcoidia bacterium]